MHSIFFKTYMINKEYPIVKNDKVDKIKDGEVLSFMNFFQ